MIMGQPAFPKLFTLKDECVIFRFNQRTINLLVLNTKLSSTFITINFVFLSRPANNVDIISMIAI